ncbi:MAG: TRAP transporter small permease [Deltaproteobacteria bacterium]|nr:TRAP transporter small permease [Deltaproteobacteria bacterium]
MVEKTVHTIARWLNWLADSAIVAIMVIVCLNVLGRDLFGVPLDGTVDMVSLLGAFVIAGAIAHTQVLKGHIRITLFIELLPRPIRTILACLIDFVGMVLFGIISWQTILFAIGTHEIGELSEVLKIPITPFAVMVSVGCMALTLVLLTDLISLFSKGVEK